MTAKEYVKDCESSCGMAAEDCKSAADYAAYNFKHGFQDEARKYVKLLGERVSRLNAELASLDYAIKKADTQADTFTDYQLRGGL